jgi:hypothetical protein
MARERRALSGKAPEWTPASGDAYEGLDDGVDRVVIDVLGPASSCTPPAVRSVASHPTVPQMRQRCRLAAGGFAAIES